MDLLRVRTIARFFSLRALKSLYTHPYLRCLFCAMNTRLKLCVRTIYRNFVNYFTQPLQYAKKLQAVNFKMFQFWNININFKSNNNKKFAFTANLLPVRKDVVVHYNMLFLGTVQILFLEQAQLNNGHPFEEEFIEEYGLMYHYLQNLAQKPFVTCYDVYQLAIMRNCLNFYTQD